MEWEDKAQFHDAYTLVSRYTKLEEYSAHALFPELTTLDLEKNGISTIDLSNNTNICFLNLRYNKLKSISLGPLSKLTVL